MNIDLLKNEYQIQAQRAQRLKIALCEQMDKILTAHDISLGVPIESRVKEWSSLENKLERSSLDLQNIVDLNDLIGIRLILLFRRDIATVSEILFKTFHVLSMEDTGARLSETQFGYQSLHHVIKLPKSWLEIPTFSDLGELKAEIQVRTLAQHIWAAASHRLQYKHEDSVPLPIRRSIHRASALLETVDLEFERVLSERQSYLKKAGTQSPDEDLNVDLLSSVLSSTFPIDNKTDNESYADLLPDLIHFKIDTVSKLRHIINKNYKKTMEEEKQLVRESGADNDLSDTLLARVTRGVYYAHVGLMRAVMRQEFGKAFDDYMKSRVKKITRNY